MRRKLCLGSCSLAGSGLCLLLLAEIPFSFWIYNSFLSQKNIVYVTEIINFPLVSGIMLLCSASLYMPMLTLGSHRLNCSVLGLTLFMFMMKFEFSCQSLELISHLAQPVCLNNIEEDAAFLYPTNCRNFLFILFIHIFGRSIHTYFFRCKVSASHISASTRCLILRIFSKTFPSAAHPKNFSCPRVK